MVWAALEAFTRLPQIVEIAVISVCVMVSLFATFPWSRSFWTVFLYLAGAMGERPARAQDGAEAAAAGFAARESLSSLTQPLAVPLLVQGEAIIGEVIIWGRQPLMRLK